MNAGTEPYLRDLWVNLSYSPCPSGESLGFNARQMDKLAMRCAQFWLAKDCRLLFGHDWRPDGVMRSIGNLAELSAPFEFQDRKLSFPRLLNLVPHPTTQTLERTGLEAEKMSEGLLAIRRMHSVNARELSQLDASSAKRMKLSSIDQELRGVAQQSPWLNQMFDADWNSSAGIRLSILRAFMTRLLDPGIRICFGGKPSGSSGTMTGIIEEALFALCDNKPLYLIGGFGGATADFAAALSHDSDNVRYGLSKPLDICHFAALEDATAAEARVIKSLTTEFGLPVKPLSRSLPKDGLRKLCKANGLTADENRILFGCTDMETALELIHEGVRRIFRPGHDSEPRDFMRTNA